MRDSRGKRIVVLFLDRLARRKREGPHGASMEGPKKGDVQVSPRASVNGSNLRLTLARFKSPGFNVPFDPNIFYHLRF